MLREVLKRYQEPENSADLFAEPVIIFYPV